MNAVRLARSVFDRALAAAAGRRADVVLKSDGGGWILDQFCAQLQTVLDDRLSVYTSAVPVAGLRRSVVHFVGSECFYDVNWRRGYHESNAIVGTWWHGSATTDDASVRAAFARLLPVSREIARVHVTCELSRAAVRDAGVPDGKIALVPMGVDAGLFRPPSAEERRAVRAELSIPEQAFVVGSFQKDGVGWGEGTTPKLIKGPDILVQTLGALAQKLPIVALVPGPARGYVRNALEKAGVELRARPLVAIETFRRYYHACDAYLMTGREEGGPASVLESLASGTPFVGHRAGMAPDVIEDGVNGFLTAVGDVDSLVDRVARLAADSRLRASFTEAGLVTARRYAWPAIAEQYLRLYESVKP